LSLDFVNFIKDTYKKVLARLPNPDGQGSPRAKFLKERGQTFFIGVLYFVPICYNYYMFANPKFSVGALDLKEGMRVADLGAGSGFYTLAASVSVGHTGKIYAVEVQRDLVKKFESEIKKKGINNIDVIWGDIEKEGGTKIADQSIDRVIISNVLSQASDKIGLIDEAKRILKSGGLALVIDLTGAHLRQNHLKHHIVDANKAKDLFTKRGFKVMKDISTDSHHYGIIFTA